MTRWLLRANRWAWWLLTPALVLLLALALHDRPAASAPDALPAFLATAEPEGR